MLDGGKRPIAFVLAATHHGPMLVNRHDYNTDPNGVVFGVGHQLLTSSCFDPEEVRTLLRLLEMRRASFGDGVVALDCGANIGVHTIEWARVMHGWGEVVAIEAQERVFYALAGNIALNNCFNARALWAAVGGEKGEMLIPVLDHSAPASFGSLELRPADGPAEFIGQPVDRSPQNCARVEVITLDSLDLPRIDLIKLDIEGMEQEALAGAQAALERHRPQVVVEKIKSDEAALRRFFETRGYRIFDFGLNLLCIHESDPAHANVRQA